MAAAAPAQQIPLKKRWMPKKSLRESQYNGSEQNRIILKIADDAGAVAADGKLTNTPGKRDLSAVAAILEKTRGARVEAMITLDSPSLERLRNAAKDNLHEEMADLSQYFFITFPDGTDVIKIIAELHARADVENAYRAHGYSRPGNIGNPITPNFTADQGYRGAAPAGVDANFANSSAFYGVTGRGFGVRVCDIEGQWTLTHEDLQVMGPSAYLGPANAPDNFNHGTACAGIIAGDNDIFGVTGIAPNARLRVITDHPATGVNVPNAIVFATTNLQRGDVILLESVANGPNAAQIPANVQFGTVADEFDDANYNAIRTAVGNGFIIIEAAGNGQQDFDSDDDTGGAGVASGSPDYLLKFDVTQRDSGAIIVGGATSGVPHVANASTNIGRRVDACAWGQNITTLGYGNKVGFNRAIVGGNNINKFYTDVFGGSSGASAITSAVSGVLSANHWRDYYAPWMPQALRLLYRTTGTSTGNGPADGLGRQPDLREQLRVCDTGANVSLVNTASGTERFGTQVTFAGDVDNDNWKELIVGSPRNHDGAGSIDMIYGHTGARYYRVNGPQAGGAFGFSVISIPDLDGDGIADIAVGAPSGGNLGPEGAPPPGVVYILSGFDGTIINTINGSINGEGFGWALAPGDDFDLDGIPEIIIGAIGTSADPPTRGAIYAYGPTTGVRVWSLDGPEGNAEFGFSIANIGDIDNDGFYDFAVGAPDPDTTEGRTFIISGQTQNILLSKPGSEIGAFAGFAVASAMDVNNDGVPDIIIGSPNVKLGLTYGGRVDTISGSNFATLQMYKGTFDDRLGYSVSAAGDMDHDGKNDIIVGAPGDWSTVEGRVFVSSIANNDLVKYVHGEFPGDGFGQSVAGGARMNDDLEYDFVVLASGFANQSQLPPLPNAGRAYVYLGSKFTNAGLKSSFIGTPGCFGPENLYTDTPPKINSTVNFICSNAPPNATGVFFASFGEAVNNDPFNIGLFIYPDISGGYASLNVASNAGGVSTLAIPLPNDPGIVGTMFVTQEVWFWSPSPCPLPTIGFFSFSSSNELTVTILP